MAPLSQPKTINFPHRYGGVVWASFVYIPKEVRSPVPLSAYCRIDSENMEQFERTIIIADEGTFGHYSAAFTTPIYAGKSRHSAVVELIVKAQMRYTTLQNWDANVYHLVTKRTDTGMHLGNGWTAIWAPNPSLYLMKEEQSLAERRRSKDW